jgi:hypothetical protein
VPEPETSPLLETLRWLAAHAGFPAARLPERAELLLLIATAAPEDERATASRQVAKPGSGNTFNARLRSYTIQRRHAHVKCDNSVKV